MLRICYTFARSYTPLGDTPVILGCVCTARVIEPWPYLKEIKLNIDTHFNQGPRNEKNDTLFKGNLITQNCVNKSVFFLFCAWILSKRTILE